MKKKKEKGGIVRARVTRNCLRLPLLSMYQCDTQNKVRTMFLPGRNINHWRAYVAISSGLNGETLRYRLLTGKNCIETVNGGREAARRQFSSVVHGKRLKKTDKWPLQGLGLRAEVVLNFLRLCLRRKVTYRNVTSRYAKARQVADKSPRMLRY